MLGLSRASLSFAGGVVAAAGVAAAAPRRAASASAADSNRWQGHVSSTKPSISDPAESAELEARVQAKLAEIRAAREAAVRAAEAAAREAEARKELTEVFRKCRPIVVCGPSGAGKSTLIRKLMKKYPGNFGFSVSHTTRAPRPGEKEGVDYHYTDVETMEHEIEAGKFIESAEVHGNFYGTSKEAVAAVSSKHQVCVLDIDVQGVHSVQGNSACSDFVYVFVRPPSLTSLSERLHARGTESLTKIRRRVSNAAREMLAAESMRFDATIVNDDLEEAFQRFDKFVKPIMCNCRSFRRRKSQGSAPL
jgi:guanylate kinase